MKTIDEQMGEITHRSGRIKREARERAWRLKSAGIVCCSLVIVTAVAMVLPKVSGSLQASDAAQYGSLVLAPVWFGYVVIGVLAFLLGVCVTLLCLHLRRRDVDADVETKADSANGGEGGMR